MRIYPTETVGQAVSGQSERRWTAWTKLSDLKNEATEATKANEDEGAFSGPRAALRAAVR
jgi:hypothetical protein